MGGPGQCSWYSFSLRAGRSRDQFPLEAIISATIHISPGAYPSFLYIGYSQAQSGWGVVLTTHPHLVQMLKKE